MDTDYFGHRWPAEAPPLAGSDVYVRLQCTAPRCLHTAPRAPHCRWDRGAALPHQLRAKQDLLGRFKSELPSLLTIDPSIRNSPALPLAPCQITCGLMRLRVWRAFDACEGL